MPEAADGEQIAPVLPAGRHFAVTWSLPTEFAGRTNAMLHRSRAFAESGGRPVDILTFDDFRDYGQVREQLSEDGFLSEGTSVLNLWEDLPSLVEDLDGPDLNQAFEEFAPLASWSGPVVDLDGPHPRRARYAVDGTLLQVDHFRADGSLLLSDRHDARELGTHGGRSLILCDGDGRPIRRFGSSWGLYRAWLEFLVGNSPAWFVVDNKNTARFMATFKRENAVLLYVIHESHLMSHNGGFASELTPSAKEVFPHLDRFDGVVYLTEQQAGDVHLRYADVGNSFVIPNGRSIGGTVDPTAHRVPGLGIQAASLNRRKRVDHSIRAVHRVRTSTDLPVQLDSFGEGSQRESLEALIGELEVGDIVRLRGHSKQVGLAFQRASFSLLTSTSEALALVLVESMAAGCVPITYDMPYGPAAVIESGVNGFIVEQGNVEKLADCIKAFLALPEEEQLALRTAALERAQDFSDSSVVSRWAEVMREVWERKHRTPVVFTVAIPSSDYCVRSGGRLRIEVLAQVSSADTDLPSVPTFFCTVRARQQQDFFRVEASEAVATVDGAYRLLFDFDPAATRSLGPSTVDFTLEARCAGSRATTRMPLHGDPVSLRVYSTRHGSMSMTLS
ncbi:glycosyltransferase [Arthrobacter sp. MDB2-24]